MYNCLVLSLGDTMVIYCFDDHWTWGKRLLASSKSLNIESYLFNNPQDVKNVPDTFAFVHLTHHPIHIRERDKKICQMISQKINVKLIPSITECMMYDEKIAYHEKCPSWGPKTFILRSKDNAINVLDSMEFPMISKSSDGAASSNVRLIKDKDSAMNEIKSVFSQSGIKKYDSRQTGYLLWQEFCPNNPNDWRVIVIAKKYGYILKRYNRSNVPFASGSGNLEPVVCLDEVTSSLLELTRKFAVENDFIFVGVDIVFDKNRKPVILEMTTGWDINGYKNCMIHKYDGSKFIPIGLDGKDHLFDIIVRACLDHDF